MHCDTMTRMTQQYVYSFRESKWRPVTHQILSLQFEDLVINEHVLYERMAINV